MKRLFNRRTATAAALFILAGTVAVGLGVYRNSLSEERASFKMELPGGAGKEVVLDLAKQGLPKALVQPGWVSFSSGHTGGIKNKGDKPLLLRISPEGFPGQVHMHSATYGLDERTGILGRPVAPGKEFDLSLDVEIPPSYRNGAGFTGLVRFLDAENGKEVGALPLRIANSAAPFAQTGQSGDKDCCTAE